MLGLPALSPWLIWFLHLYAAVKILISWGDQFGSHLIYNHPWALDIPLSQVSHQKIYCCTTSIQCVSRVGWLVWTNFPKTPHHALYCLFIRVSVYSSLAWYFHRGKVQQFSEHLDLPYSEILASMLRVRDVLHRSWFNRKTDSSTCYEPPHPFN